MDLLDSILSKMEKPPSVDDKRKKQIKEQQRAHEEARTKERAQLSKFRKEVEEYVTAFMRDDAQQKMPLAPMDQVARSVVRDVAEVAGLTSYTFGVEGEDRHVMLFKKDYAIDDRELEAYRLGQDWDPDAADRMEKELAEEKRSADFRHQLEAVKNRQAARHGKPVAPQPKFLAKIERLVGGGQTGKGAARQITAADTRQFGYVTAEHKKDKRTIEETLMDIRAKKQKTAHDNAALDDTAAPVHHGTAAPPHHGTSTAQHRNSGSFTNEHHGDIPDSDE